jgi:O-antigen/teichoic acid export membrane protein
MKNKDLMFYFLGMGGTALLGLITFPVLTWLFTAEDIGSLSLFQILASLLVLVISLGLDQSYVREYHVTPNKASLAKTAFYPSIIIAILIICYLSIRLFFYNTGDEKFFNSYFFLFFALAVLILNCERFFSVFIRMKEWVVLYSLAKLSSKLSFLILVSLVYFYKDLRSLEFLVPVQVISWAVGVLLMFIVLRGDLIKVIKAKFDHVFFKSGLGFGFPLVINGIAFWGITSLDRVMLEIYSSLAEVGIYSIALGISGVAVLGQQLFTILWHPIVYKWHSQGVEVENIFPVYEKVQLVAMLLISLVGIFSWLIPVFLPNQYIVLQGFVVACMIGPLFIMIGEVSGIGISITKRTAILPLITILSLAANITLNYILIPSLGAAGAAIATASSFFVYLVLKTQISANIWKPLPNSKMYIFALMVSVISILSAIFASKYIIPFTVTWVVFFILVSFFYKKAILSIILDFQKRREN